jgi:predicted AAA+ superfamily ATPase
MEKDVIQKIIVENQNKIRDNVLIKRNIWYEPKFNYVFTGLRRAGKSYFMLQIAQQLLSQGHLIEEFLFFNFEDDRLENLQVSDFDLIKRSYEEMFEHQPIFFLDEIQIVDRWDKFARRLADSKYRVYITGSNAKMFSKEVATTLGGRYLIKDIFPFSFAEYLLANNIDVQEKNAQITHYTVINKLFRQHFAFGGLPEQIPIIDKRDYLSSLYQRIYLGDIVARNQIRNENALRLLVKKLAENIKQPVSYTRLANIVSSAGKKISVDTVIDYIANIKDSYLIFSLENLNSRFVERETNKKYYFTDNGLLNLFLIDPNASLLENLVAINLYKKYKEELFYFHNGVEVDFVVPDENLAVQAAYSLSDFDTRNREINALVQLSKRYEIKKYLIITKDEEEIISKQGVEIQAVPVWKWLLE